MLVTAGVNEKSGGATDRSDPEGRLKLLDTNVGVYTGTMVPRIVEAAPDAVILVVTDPPDPLADLARRLAGHDRVLSTGTLLDSLRFRVHLAQRLEVSPASVEAQVVGEHGTSEVLLWSTARVGGVPIAEALPPGSSIDEFRKGVEHDVRFANIAIIEGNEASQFGIGIVSARIAEAVLRDEQAVFPIGAYNAAYGVTLSLPSVVGRQGVSRILEPAMSDEERQALRASAEVLRKAVQRTSRALLLRWARRERGTACESWRRSKRSRFICNPRVRRRHGYPMRRGDSRASRSIGGRILRSETSCTTLRQREPVA